jgi:uncharacterized membrane protein
MESRVAIYKSHEEALKAVQKLKDQNFPVNKISLIGEAQIINDHLYVKSLDNLKNMPLAIGTIAGVVTGLLSGIGIFIIPGFGFLYGAGAIIGALGGLDIGIIGGGLATILTHMGIKKEEVLKYEEHIKSGRFLVMANGTESEISRAEKILLGKKKQPQIS